MPDDATTPRTADPIPDPIPDPTSDPAPDGGTPPPDVLPGTGPGNRDAAGSADRADVPRPAEREVLASPRDEERPAGPAASDAGEEPGAAPPGDAGSTVTAGSLTVSTLTAGTLAADAAAGARADAATTAGPDAAPGVTAGTRAVPSDGGGLDRSDVATPVALPATAAEPAAALTADPAAGPADLSDPAGDPVAGAPREAPDRGHAGTTAGSKGTAAAPAAAPEPGAERDDEEGQRAARHALPEPDTHAGFFEREDGVGGAGGGAGAAGPPSRAVARARLGGAMRPRISRGQLLGAALCALLGFALVVQVRQTQEQGLESLRQTDLVNVLDNVTRESQRLENDSAALQETLDRLSSGSGNSQAAQEAARQRLEVLGILVGTLPAQGKGIELVIDDPRGEVNASVLLDTLQELRDAGAEAVQIGNVRVVASTSFVDVPEGVRVDGTVLERPFRMKVIGDPETLSSALDIPGGVLEVLRQKGAEGRIAKPATVTIDALRAVRPPQYARPAPDQAP